MLNANDFMTVQTGRCQPTIPARVRDVGGPGPPFVCTECTFELINIIAFSAFRGDLKFPLDSAFAVHPIRPLLCRALMCIPSISRRGNTVSKLLEQHDT